MAKHAREPVLNEPRENEFGQPVGESLPDWGGAEPPARVTLEGRFARLVPLEAAEHADELFAAFATANDGRDWTYLPEGPFSTLDEFRAWLDRAEASEDPLHYTVLDTSNGAAVGTLSLLRHDPANGAIEVGWVVFSPLMQRTPIATEAQFLLMRYVFDDLGYRRYEWKCDSLNAPSVRAAKRLGFTFEGTFRQAAVVKGRNRDTAWFAMTDADWPRVKQAMEAWLDPANFGEDGAQREPLRILNAASEGHKLEA